MKTIYNTLLSILALSLLVGCSDPLAKKVKTSVDVFVNNELQEGDIIEVKKSQPVTFHFEGNPDFISFYSGEAGSEYKMRDKTESTPEDITSELEFSTFTKTGTPAGSLKVYLSTEFEGLTKDIEQDRENVKLENAHWIDITDLSNLPEGNGEESERIRIPLDQYMTKDLTIAFHYCPESLEMEAKPLWEIKDLKIINTNKNGQESYFYAVGMGFTPFDLIEKVNPYQIAQKNNDEGVWNTTFLQEANPYMKIHSTAKKNWERKQDNWLISNPLKINTRTPDKGASIKTIHAAVEDYVYQYADKGEYTATFVFTNENYDHRSQVIKEYTIKVTE